mgnify:CR=1 FL=1|tara:strand:+ start:531 stop:776 length:246 start_codon:yes stop_codon:yes gene_type:complete
MKIKMLGSQSDLTAATDLSHATLVRVYNSTAGDLVLTQKLGSTVLGTMTVPSKGIELVSKMPADTLEGGVGLKVVSIAKTS